MKVYVCTSGRYSDYSITAIFSTRAAAERYTAGDDEANNVEEYEVDDAVDNVYGQTWRADVIKDDGRIIENLPYSPTKMRHPERCEVQEHARFIQVVSPISAEHAAKVAAETRQEWLRSRVLGGPPNA